MRRRKFRTSAGIAAAAALLLTVSACSSASTESGSSGSPSTNTETTSPSQESSSSSESPVTSGESTGTSSEPATSDVSGKVTVWMYPVIGDEAASQKFWQETTQEFDKAYPNVDLTIQLQPWANREQTISAAIAASKGPDLVLVTPDMLAGFQSIGGLKSLKGAIEGDQDKFNSGAIAAATVDGDIYAVPIYQTVTAPVYNKKLFDEAGITTLPETWDEIKADAPKLAANGVAILDYAGNPDVTLNMTFYPLLWQAGGTVFSQDGKSVAFDGAEGQAALQFLLDLNGSKGLPADAATKENTVEGGVLATGKAAMSFMTTDADAQTLAKAIGADNVVVGAPLKDKDQVTFGLPGLLARTSISTDANEAAVDAVAKFLASAPQQTKLAVASGFFPARSDAEMGTESSDPFREKFAAALPMARAGEVNVKSRQVMAALVPHLQSALQGSSTAQEALAAAAAEANGILQGG